MSLRIKGLTIIEILIVISILAVLLGLGFVMSAPAREKARERVCANNLKQIFGAMALYVTDHPESAIAGLGDIPDVRTVELLPYS